MIQRVRPVRMRRTSPPTPGKGRRAGVFWRGRAGYFGGSERGASHVTTQCDLLTHAQCRQRVGPRSLTPRYRRRFSCTGILGDLIVLVSTVHRQHAGERGHITGQCELIPGKQGDSITV